MQFLMAMTGITFCLFVTFRLVFLLFFSDINAFSSALIKALGIGIRFDLRLAILVVVPLILLVMPRFNLVTHPFLRLVARGYLMVAIFLVSWFYIIDFGHYAYLGIRINSTVLRFLDDLSISASMMWQSYPVVTILLGWIAGMFAFYRAILWLEHRCLNRPARVTGVRVKLLGATVVFVLAIIGIHGQILSINIYNPVPLRWNDAFFSGDSRIAAVAINPVLFFFDTFEQREAPYDEERVRQYYPLVADYLGVEDRTDLNLDRFVGQQPHRLVFDTPPNVVFVMLESLGASRVGIYGNPVLPSPTPNLDELAREGWLFHNFYVPVSGTARTVWASLTGLPDVSSGSTATRNPMITNQRVVLNAFTDHDKYYFIGGAAGWANMSAFIRRSIPDIKLYEEDAWDAPIVDVWGISDLDLFKAVDQILRNRESEQPFFAYIQTAGNHRPFTIPDNNDDFASREDLSDDELDEAGFRSNAQFNAVRLLDYNVGRLMEMAAASGYLSNTLFVFFGDHNNRITRTPFMPPHFEPLDLDGLHVPHIIYAPGLLQPREIEQPVSLVDVVPSIAGLLGIEYTNTTMGRDFNSAQYQRAPMVFTQTADRRYPVIGMVSEEVMARLNYDGTDAKLHPLAEPARDLSQEQPVQFARMRDLARGIYEMTKWQFYANLDDYKRQDDPGPANKPD